MWEEQKTTTLSFTTTDQRTNNYSFTFGPRSFKSLAAPSKSIHCWSGPDRSNETPNSVTVPPSTTTAFLESLGPSLLHTVCVEFVKPSTHPPHATSYLDAYLDHAWDRFVPRPLPRKSSRVLLDSLSSAIETTSRDR